MADDWKDVRDWGSGLDRRSFLGAIAALAAMAPGSAGAGPFYTTSRAISRDMASKYKLNDDDELFNELFGVQDAFRGLKAFPEHDAIIFEALKSLNAVLDGYYVNKKGYRRVARRNDKKMVIFSDHHILPSEHRQGAVWRANRGPYVELLNYYAERDYLICENGDVEDLVIMEPSQTFKAYQRIFELSGSRKKGRKALLEWFRRDPLELLRVMHAERMVYRRQQFLTVLNEGENKPYYAMLARLAAANQLVRVAGNHDYQLQEFDVMHDYLVPQDILILGTDHPTVVMHGHQFDAATNPAVAPFYGEIISECLGVFYQGPDRYWSPHEAEKMIKIGFPNRLSTHHPPSSVAGSFLGAVLSDKEKDDEEWARAWEALFGHPIAWEYGADNWETSIKYGWARPGNVIDNAMSGRQFFKYRHLDEWALCSAMQHWNVNIRLALGHSHEIRKWRFSPGGPSYVNSGAAGRFARLIWALEFEGDKVTVVGWFAKDKIKRYVFEARESEMSSYFHPIDSGVVV